MSDIKGPAVDPEAFRVEGHCCGIRLPVMKTLTEDGIRFELTPEAKAQLIAEGVLPADGGRDQPKTVDSQAAQPSFGAVARVSRSAQRS